MAWDGITERRRHRRARVQMVIESEGWRADPPGRLQILNLSAGGFYCEVDHPIETLTRLALGLEFPPFGAHPHAARTLECEAVVVRSEADPRTGRCRIATCFTHLAAEDRRYLDEFVAWYNEVFGAGPRDQGDRNEAA